MTTRPLPSSQWRRQAALDLALAVPAVFVLAGWLVVAIVHLDDTYEVGHGQGVWMALARHANVSGLYPEVFDGTSYGGSRYMPLPILAHAALARLTGEYLTAGKLLGLFTTAGTVVVAFVVLRSIGCRWSWGLALCALPIGGFSGLRAGTTIGGDALPVMLGLGALALIIRSQGQVALVAAAVLAALGVSAKFTAVWAPAAILIWLFVMKGRRRAAAFAAYAVAAAVVLLGGFTLLSDGRMIDNLRFASDAGVQGIGGFVRAPTRLLSHLVNGETAVWALLPVVIYAAATRRWPVRAAVFPIAWVVAAGTLVAVFADIGTGPNQLLDLAVLTALCTGALVASSTEAERDRVLVMVVAVILAWSGVTAFGVRLRPPVRDALAAVATGDDAYPRDVLDGRLPADGLILSEDPGVLVEQDRSPVVFDPFMLRRLATTHPAAVGQLVRRVEAREFDVVVLVVELQDPADTWWREYHFGTKVMAAVKRGYQLDEQRGRYFLYRRRS